MVNELSAEKLRKVCDPNVLSCETTEDLIPLQEIIGQERAVRALKFGLGINEHGFNVYVAGFPGTGRTTAVKNFLEEMARTKPVPSDWCYVNNFSNEYEPQAIKLPPGRGKDFQRDMKSFVENARSALSKTFESEDYATKREATIKTMESQRQELIEQLNGEARKESFVIQSTPVGLLLIPLIKGKPVSDQELMALPQKAREEIQNRRERLESELRSAMRQFADMDRKIHQELEKMNRVVKPDLKIYVGEALTGNAIVEQVKEFDSIIGVDGVILTKADVDEKGGAALSVFHLTGKPILYLGVGQELDDLQEFSPDFVVRNLLT